LRPLSDLTDLEITVHPSRILKASGKA